jgi:hypothetical protein
VDAAPTLKDCASVIAAWLAANGYGDAVNPTLSWESADGRPASLPLPLTAAVRPAKIDPPNAHTTPMQAAVLTVVNEMKVGEELSYDEIADKAGYANTGHLRAYLKELEATGRVRVQITGTTRLK